MVSQADNVAIIGHDESKFVLWIVDVQSCLDGVGNDFLWLTTSDDYHNDPGNIVASKTEDRTSEGLLVEEDAVVPQCLSDCRAYTTGQHGTGQLLVAYYARRFGIVQR